MILILKIQNLQKKKKKKKKWYIIDSESNANYSKDEEIKFLTRSNITIPIYNLIEYSDNYSDTSGILWQFKRNEIINNADVTNDNNAPSFRYKASIIGNTENNGTKNGVKVAVPLKYLSNFWRSLEMPLINCKVELSLK